MRQPAVLIGQMFVGPKHKGAKLDAEQFAKVTGWTGSSNQHERDADMVAWQYRGRA